jgi:hypothetical protein
VIKALISIKDEGVTHTLQHAHGQRHARIADQGLAFRDNLLAAGRRLGRSRGAAIERLWVAIFGPHRARREAQYFG